MRFNQRIMDAKRSIGRTDGTKIPYKSTKLKPEYRAENREKKTEDHLSDTNKHCKGCQYYNTIFFTDPLRPCCDLLGRFVDGEDSCVLFVAKEESNDADFKDWCGVTE